MAEYYMYSHTRTDKFEVFYIGISRKKGNENNYHRAYDIKSRNPIWKKIFKKCNSSILISIIEESDNLEYIQEREIEEIKRCGKICEETGYLSNIGDGGEHTNHSARKVIQYDLDGDFLEVFEGTPYVALKLKINEKGIYMCCIGKSQSCGGYMWKYWTKDFPRNIGKYEKSNWKSVLQYDPNLNFITAYENVQLASESTGIDSASIKKVCYGQRRLAGGYIWKFPNDQLPLIFEGYKNFVQIEKYSLKGEHIKSYNSISEAVKELNLNSHTAIRNCLIGKQRKAYGFIWKYKNNSIPRHQVKK